MIRFLPKGKPFPDKWVEGEYRVWMLLFGWLPVGWQAIRIEMPQQASGKYVVRDNGYSRLIKRWDQWIEITAEGTGTRYIDRVEIEAGFLTPLIWAFARLFYAYRQRRWQRLVARRFAYD